MSSQSHQTNVDQVGKVDQLPFLIGVVAGVNLIKLANFNRLALW